MYNSTSIALSNGCNVLLYFIMFYKALTGIRATINDKIHAPRESNTTTFTLRRWYQNGMKAVKKRSRVSTNMR